MPLLRVEMFDGRTPEKKKKLVEALTETVCQVLELKPEDVSIILDEYKRENWAKGGLLYSDPSRQK